MTSPSEPTPTDLLAACSRVLEQGGYRPIREGFPDWNTPSTRLFEDEYNVVGIAVRPTCAELIRCWADLQGSLVDLVSAKVGQLESKAWDGYLVLLTPGMAPLEGTEIEEIRRDTTRVRKLVATGGDLSSAGDVERVLRSLLPLPAEPSLDQRCSALDRLPDLLAHDGIHRDTTTLLVQAFINQEPMMDVLHRARGKT